MVNGCELVVSVSDEVDEFGVEGGSAIEKGSERVCENFGMKSESDVGGGLNDGIQ